eukprot:m.52166 g.52166  ORF g.52166 m.52166 type:complete len:265 (+) comp7605_c0_seq1:141-935(+)
MTDEFAVHFDDDVEEQNGEEGILRPRSMTTAATPSTTSPMSERKKKENDALAMYDNDKDEDEFGEGDIGAEIKRLQKAWMNEKLSPSLLQYERQLVGTITREINDQDEATREEELKEVEDKFIFYTYHMELERLRFLVASYLRTRLLKIEKYATYINNTPSIQSRLSDNERSYLVRYCELVDKHFSSSFLERIPENIAQDLDGNRMTAPNMDDHVLCKFDTDIGALDVGDETSTTHIDVSIGDVYIVRYNTVDTLIRKNEAHLI